MSERKNIKRNKGRVSAKDRPKVGGAGFGGRMWFPTSNLSAYERYLVKLGIS